VHIDVEDLRDFYATPLGNVVRRTLARQVRARWPSVKGQTLVGLGFASPYLGAFRGEARSVAAFMPSGQGALVWPSTGRTMSVLIEEARLPLPDNSVDRLLAVHFLEAAERIRPVLREIWRVLSAEGTLQLIVPNRRGVWARLDTTPFGSGRPFSRAQLEALLKEALLTPVEFAGALHMPPLDRRMLLKSAGAFEKVGRLIAPAFSGVVIVEARKELEAPIGRTAKARSIGEFAAVRGGDR